MGPGRTHKTEAEVEAPPGGGAPAAVGRTGDLGIEAPGATTQDTLGAISVVTILHPLPHIPAHIVQAIAV